MKFTGERVVAGATPKRIYQDHVARYRWAIDRIPDGARTLDVGCGTGYGTQMLSSRYQVCDGIDLSGEAVSYAAANHPGPRYHVGRADSLPFADASFDAVTCFEVIEHVPNPDEVLAEIRRVLVCDGGLFISTPNARVTSPRGNMNKFHEREFDEGSFRSLLGSAGFSIKEFAGQRQRRQLWYAPIVRSLIWPIREREGPNWGESVPANVAPGLVPRYFVVSAMRAD